MSVYGNNIEDITSLNEAVLLEAFEIGKDDLKDENKIKKILKKLENNENESIIEIITLLLAIVAAILAKWILLGLSLNILTAIYVTFDKQIEKIKDRRRNKQIDRILNKYKKHIEKFKKQLEKETDPEKKKEIEKVIKYLEEFIKNINKKRIDIDYTKEIKDGLEIIKRITDGTLSSDCNELSLQLFYYDLSRREFEKLAKENKQYENVKSMINNRSDESELEFYNYLTKYGKDTVFIYTIDDTLLAYNFNRGVFYLGDWVIEYLNEYSFDTYKNKYKDLFDDDCWEDVIKADTYLGYYRLSKVPKGIDPIPLPKLK